MLTLVINKTLLSQQKHPSLALKCLLTLILLLSLASCSTQNQQAHHASIIVFGTTVNITVYHHENELKNAIQAIQTVEKQFHLFHKKWHAWEPGGIVSKINQAITTNTPIKINDSVKSFIIKSQELTLKSHGLFDPGIGQLIALWGFHGEEWQGPPPKEQLITEWLATQPSILDIYFKNDMLYSKNSGVQLDFGGNAKGLAIDIALQSLKDVGIKNAIVSIGGDMKAIGLKNGQPWNIGIQNPFKPREAIASIHLNSGESIVTSGTYQRYFEWQGKRYSHILNPKTGYPANSFASVTVVHPDAVIADSAATALLIAGPENWKRILISMQIKYAMLIDKQGKIFQTESMSKRIKLLEVLSQ
ncbi:MAG: FAD:protein FMN transferase [Thiomicrorhabdus sp.]|nr:MAG: FAD:protein FMN transferase [Thiomicrorhabdus sp.]